MRIPRIAVAAVVALAGAAALMIPVGGGDVGSATEPDRRPVTMDLSAFPETPPAKPLRLLFIHHSVGGQMLADPGPAKALAESIYTTHPNGGGLRRRLQAASYQVFETSYGSSIGEKTDLFDWLPKFRDRMDDVLTTSGNDAHHQGGVANDIVVFKSCYPNNRFMDEGEAPGDPNGPELTLWNAKATLSALLPELARRPDTLFVYMTAPPVAPRGYAQPAWKWLAKKMLGKPSVAANVRRQGAIAREFNDWVASPDGWLKGYAQKNVVVFDLYDVLTGGASNLSRYPTGDGDDSHPSSAGNQQAAERFVGFLNRAVHRAGLDPEDRRSEIQPVKP